MRQSVRARNQMCGCLRNHALRRQTLVRHVLVILEWGVSNIVSDSLVSHRYDDYTQWSKLAYVQCLMVLDSVDGRHLSKFLNMCLLYHYIER